MYCLACRDELRIAASLDDLFSPATNGSAFITALRAVGMDTSTISRATDPHVITSDFSAIPPGSPSASVYCMFNFTPHVEWPSNVQVPVAAYMGIDSNYVTIVNVVANPQIYIVNFTFYNSTRALADANAASLSSIITSDAIRREFQYFLRDNGFPGFSPSTYEGSPMLAITLYAFQPPAPPPPSPIPPSPVLGIQPLPHSPAIASTVTLVSIAGYTNATFSPSCRSAFLNALTVATGATNGSLSIAHVANAANGDVVLTVLGPSADITAAVRGSIFLEMLRSSGLPAATAVRVVREDATNVTPPSSDNGVSATVWAIVAVSTVALASAIAWVYVKRSSKNNPRAPAKPTPVAMIRLKL